MIRLALQDYRLFPYERALAAREVEALGADLIKTEDQALIVNGAPNLDELRRLTYVARIELPDGSVVEPEAARIEANSRGGSARSGRRQVTRYHLHGLHEYKGKFNPQTVRAFANVLGLQPDDWLIDPFCGSGTSLVEGLSMGANVLGIDRSPMATLIARAKVKAFKAQRPDAVADELHSWVDSVSPRIDLAQESARINKEGLSHLDINSREYVEHWFTPSALAGLSEALAGLQPLRGVVRLLVEVSVSSICRVVSMQRPEDLRVRRQPADFEAPAVAPLLRAAIERTVTGLRELDQLDLERGGRALVRHGSSSTPHLYEGLPPGRQRVVITSPPYATALPYIDTDRLSIALLGLAPAANLSQLERNLIGSREWTAKENRQWSSALANNAEQLPDAVVSLCQSIAVAHEGGGFRRRALAGLLYRYFTFMRSSFTALHRALGLGDCAALIVGANQTKGEEMIEIPTPELLAEVSEQAGFELQEIVPLQTYPRFGIHQANGIREESAIILKPS